MSLMEPLTQRNSLSETDTRVHHTEHVQYYHHPVTVTESDLQRVAVSHSHKVGLFRIRWVMLLIFVLSSASNAIYWTAFSPIISAVNVYYDVSDDLVLLLSTVFMVFYPIVSIIASFLLDTVGLRTTVLIGSCLTFVGGWLQVGSGYIGVNTGGYGLLLLGQCIIAIGQPFIVNAPAQVADTWFAEDERGIATTIGALGNLVGIAIGQALSPIFVTCRTGLDNQNCIPDTVEGMDIMHYVHTSVSTFVFFLVLFFFKNKPLLPPSLVRENVMIDGVPKTFQEQLSSYLKHCIVCMTNKGFIVLFITFGVGLAGFNAVMTDIGDLFSKIGRSSDDASYAGICVIGVGIVGAGVYGFLLDKYRTYKSLLRVGFTGALCSMSIMIYVFTSGLSGDYLWVIYIGFSLFGFFGLGMLPVCLEAAAEITYPVVEGISSGLLMSIGNLVGAGFVYLLTFLSDAPLDPRRAFAIFLGIMIIPVIGSWCFDAPYLRLLYEKEIAEKAAAEDDVKEVLTESEKMNP